MGIVALVLVGIVWRLTTSGRSSEPTGSFCITYRNIAGDLAEVDRVLSGERRPSDGSIDDLRGVVGLVWSDSVASGGPSKTDADAIAIATAVRAAVAADDPAPIRTPGVKVAVERLAPVAAAVCEGNDL